MGPWGRVFKAPQVDCVTVSDSGEPGSRHGAGSSLPSATRPQPLTHWQGTGGAGTQGSIRAGGDRSGAGAQCDAHSRPPACTRTRGRPSPPAGALRPASPSLQPCRAEAAGLRARVPQFCVGASRSTRAATWRDFTFYRRVTSGCVCAPPGQSPAVGHRPLRPRLL